jgi:hypothetical protein
MNKEGAELRQCYVMAAVIWIMFWTLWTSSLLGYKDSSIPTDSFGTFIFPILGILVPTFLC